MEWSDAVEQDAQDRVERWEEHLIEQESAPATIDKYIREAHRLEEYLAAGQLELTKLTLLEYRREVIERFSPASVNVIVSAVNGYLKFLGHRDLRLRQVHVQRDGAREDGLELTRAEYSKLVQTAKRQGDERLALIVQAICSTGIRVSELRAVTVEAVHVGHATVSNKGRTRRVLLPDDLRDQLRKFALAHCIKTGPIFVTRTGRPIDRTRVWRLLKRLAKAAGVDPRKVFPHNLRHLFACAHYQKFKDMDSLSVILGHSHVDTTRIYLAREDKLRRKQINALNLVL